MSYCRFENTYVNLVDCYNNLNNELSDRENQYKEMLVTLCKDIVEEYEFVKMSEEDDDVEFEDEISGGMRNCGDNEEVSWDTQTR